MPRCPLYEQPRGAERKASTFGSAMRSFQAAPSRRAAGVTPCWERPRYIKYASPILSMKTRREGFVAPDRRIRLLPRVIRAGRLRFHLRELHPGRLESAGRISFCLIEVMRRGRIGAGTESVEGASANAG